MGDIGEPPAKIAKIQKIECNGIVGKQRNGYVDLENLGGSTGESPLIRLPKEIWSHVFEFIPQHELITHRLINKKWCEKVDTLATFHVVFHDEQEASALEELCKLRVRSCEFRCARKYFLPKLANPSLLKKIIFAPTSSENVRNILTTFTKIESLAFYTLLSLDKHFEANEGYNRILEQLKCLKQLEIGIHSFSDRQNLKSSIFDTIIGNSEIVFPALRKVRLCFSVSSSANWKHLFNWLGRHSRTLTSLELNCSCLPENEITDDDLREINMKNLLRLRLRSLQISDNAVQSNVHPVYDMLIGAQDTLVNLCVNYYGVNVNTYIKAIKASAVTLRSVKCYNVQLTERIVGLESSLFLSTCLEELVFQCIPTVVCVVLDCDGVRRYTAGIDGWQLPKSIKYLHIQGCSMPTQDLLSFCDTTDSPALTNLRELSLIDVGDYVGYGVTIQVFRKMCTLCELKVFKVSRVLGTVGTVLEEQREKETDEWMEIIDRGRRFGIYQLVEEEQESIHVFEFPSSEIRKEFVDAVELYFVDRENGEPEPEPSSNVDVGVDSIIVP